MDRLSPEHQKLLDTYGIDGETVLKDNTGKELKVYWSEAGNYIFLNPGGWGDGMFFLTTVLLHFMTNDEPMGLCLRDWLQASIGRSQNLTTNNEQRKYRQ
ncbi:MAG: hypothetical protein QF504_02150 [Nitrospinaceae bacterium]|nr:hypothetical protein [Nitrospinaceae bacterium]